jgi:hypothetical protein
VTDTLLAFKKHTSKKHYAVLVSGLRAKRYREKILSLINFFSQRNNTKVMAKNFTSMLADQVEIAMPNCVEIARR